MMGLIPKPERTKERPNAYQHEYPLFNAPRQGGGEEEGQRPLQERTP